MTDLLVRAEAFRNRIEDFGFEYLSFETRKLEVGQEYKSETAAREVGHGGAGRDLLGGELARRVAEGLASAKRFLTECPTRCICRSAPHLR